MKKVEFSKSIIIFSCAVTIVVTAFSMVMMWKTEDLSALNILLPAVFGAFGTACGFYYSKAKRENEIKLRKKYGAEIYNDVKGEDYEEIT